ncbi:MAG: peptidoglycan editing factor PgeF [Eubacterium sp.]|nr:peptidoglycan editing factor PgeF [Eubacterium sp.]
MKANRKEKNGVVYYTFPLLEREGIVHGFSTRYGGVSEGVCATMNLSFHRGDKREHVVENHRRFAEAVGYDKNNLVFSDQIHETTIRRVTREDAGKGINRESDIIGVDGLISNDTDVVLMTFFADCVPLFFYDRKNHAIGASHSGWRGTVARIGAKTIREMGKAFGTKPQDVLCVIGPSICQDCYEVSDQVAEQFQKEFDEKHWKEILLKKSEEKFQLDLWRANEIILQEAGVPENQIETSGLCTCCHPEELFSHRASHGKRGNLAGVITLAEKGNSFHE